MTAVHVEDVLSVRGLRFPAEYWDLPVVICETTQSWRQKYVLEGMQAPAAGLRSVRCAGQSHVWVQGPTCSLPWTRRSKTPTCRRPRWPGRRCPLHRGLTGPRPAGAPAVASGVGQVSHPPAAHPARASEAMTLTCLRSEETRHTTPTSCRAAYRRGAVGHHRASASRVAHAHTAY